MYKDVRSLLLLQSLDVLWNKLDVSPLNFWLFMPTSFLRTRSSISQFIPNIPSLDDKKAHPSEPKYYSLLRTSVLISIWFLEYSCFTPEAQSLMNCGSIAVFDQCLFSAIKLKPLGCTFFFNSFPDNSVKIELKSYNCCHTGSWNSSVTTFRRWLTI